MLKADIARTWDLVPGGRLRKAIGCFRTPGVHAVVWLRFGQWLLERGAVTRFVLTPVYALGNHRMRAAWGIEIAREATIGEGLYIGHFGGIVVSRHAIIGKNARLSQQVTIGVAGQGDKRGAPVIGDDVYFAPGCKVFGKIRVGDNVRIGANAVVHKDVPSNCVVRLAQGFEIVPDASAE